MIWFHSHTPFLRVGNTKALLVDPNMMGFLRMLLLNIIHIPNSGAGEEGQTKSGEKWS